MHDCLLACSHAWMLDWRHDNNCDDCHMIVILLLILSVSLVPSLLVLIIALLLVPSLLVLILL